MLQHIKPLISRDLLRGRGNTFSRISKFRKFDSVVSRIGSSAGQIRLTVGNISKVLTVLLLLLQVPISWKNWILSQQKINTRTDQLKFFKNLEDLLKRGQRSLRSTSTVL